MESLDYSDYDNGNATEEFPYWQPLIAIDIVLNFALILPSTLFWNLTVFTALIRSKLSNKPLTVLYSSLLLVLCMDKIVATIITATASPDALRFCICNILDVSLVKSFGAFSAGFSVLIITCQSLLQLQILRGKKRWNSFGKIIPCIGVSFLVAIFWSTVLFLQQNVLPALSSCQLLGIQNTTLTNAFNAENIFLGVYFVSTLLPATTTVIATSVWSVKLFKKMSIQRKIQDYSNLNKKLLLLPILMVILLVCNGPIGYLIGIAFSEVLRLAGVEDYLGSWTYFANRIAFAFVNILHGISYPIALLYFNTKLRKNWKKQLTNSRRSNRVHILRIIPMR